MPLKIKICFLLTFLLLLIGNSLAQDDPTVNFGYYSVYQNVPAAVHIQSDISDGKYSFSQITKTARGLGIKVLIFTDTAIRQWEYGIRPLENIIIRRISHDSVFLFGINNYLKALDDLQKGNPDMVIVPAVEVVPFFFWTGHFYDGTLTLYNWHKQLIVVGLEKENDYRYLPIIANYSWTPLHKANLRRLWPVLLIVLGIIASKIHPHAFSYRQWGYVLLFLGGVFLLNNLHFNVGGFDSYHGDQQTKPYQDLIDYVNKKDGLVFWAHPEAKNIDRVKDVNIVTSAYKEDLIYTHDYAGSAMLFDDSRSVAKTGDIWDKLLIDACLGRRKPIWVIGEVDYHGEGANLDSVQTIFLLEALSRIQVINALKTGKMYAKLNNKPNDFSLDAFIISDDKKENFAFMGDEIELNSTPQIIIQTSSSSNPQAPITILLIRNGQLIQEFTSQNPNTQVRFQDAYFKPGEKIYYRIMIREDNDSFRVISNPVFVKFIGG